MEHLLGYWYYHLPNYVLAALIWTLVARFFLGFFVPVEWDNYIWRFFCRFTDPVLRATSVVTPAFMVHGLLPLVAVFWLVLARVALQAAVFPEAWAFWLLILHLMGLVPATWLPAG